MSNRTGLGRKEESEAGEKSNPTFGQKSQNVRGNILGSLHFFNLLLYLCYPIMRSDEHTESNKQISLVHYSLIWWMPNFCEALPMGQIICCPYVYSVQSSILCFKKSRLRQLSNLPKVRPLGSRWAGSWGSQECLLPRLAHALSPIPTRLYS